MVVSMGPALYWDEQDQINQGPSLVDVGSEFGEEGILGAKTLR